MPGVSQHGADNGSARFDAGSSIEFVVETHGRNGAIDHVSLAGNGRIIESRPGGGVQHFTWSGVPAGFHEVRAEAVNGTGLSGVSNSVRLIVGAEDLAEGQPVSASSGEHPEHAVDGSFHTTWRADDNDPQWVQVDLEKTVSPDEIVLLWGFRSNGRDFVVETAKSDPDRPESWLPVHRRTDRAYHSWKAVDHISLGPGSPAGRYWRLRVNRRAGGWTGEGTALTGFLLLQYDQPE